MRGAFITFEGIDKSGKTTQARLLTEALTQSGRAALLTRQPGGSPLCAEIARLTRDGRHFGRMAPVAELMLYLADRAQHVHEVILPALESGRIVVCDRYTDSTVAYQGYGRGLGLDTLATLNSVATGGLVSDLTLLVDVPPEEARRRGLGRATSPDDSLDRPPSLDRMEMEQAAFFERVREGYLRIAASDPGRVTVMDGREDVDRLSEKIRAVVEAMLKNNNER